MKTFTNKRRYIIYGLLFIFLVIAFSVYKLEKRLERDNEWVECAMENNGFKILIPKGYIEYHDTNLVDLDGQETYTIANQYYSHVKIGNAIGSVGYGFNCNVYPEVYVNFDTVDVYSFGETVLTVMIDSTDDVLELIDYKEGKLNQLNSLDYNLKRNDGYFERGKIFITRNKWFKAFVTYSDSAHAEFDKFFNSIEIKTVNR